MTDENRPLRSLLRERRERVIEALSAHFAKERIDAEEFEDRVDRVYRARSLEEVEAAHSDLPVLDARAPLQTRGSTAPARKSQLLLALLGGTERTGAWRPAARVQAFAMMGGMTLDFREAILGPGVTEVDVIAVMGGIEITVPPGLNVESDGLGVLGDFDGVDHHPPFDDHDSPTLRIRGLAIMGGVQVTVRLPGEAGPERRRGRRREGKRRRRESGG